MKKIAILGALALCAAFGLPPVAHAKLPPLSPEAKLKADEAKAKTAWSDKVAAFQLCKAQERSAANYVKTAKAAGKETKPATDTLPCADPGPFVPPVPPVAAAASAPAVVAAASAPPIEAAGAHSPTATAKAPPSGMQTAAQHGGTAPPAKNK